MFLGYYQNETMSMISFSVETDHIRRVWITNNNNNNKLNAYKPEQEINK